jgi:hypothetical protein
MLNAQRFIHAPQAFYDRLSGNLAEGRRDERIEVRAAGAKRTRI